MTEPVPSPIAHAVAETVGPSHSIKVVTIVTTPILTIARPVIAVLCLRNRTVRDRKRKQSRCCKRGTDYCTPVSLDVHSFLPRSTSTAFSHSPFHNYNLRAINPPHARNPQFQALSATLKLVSLFSMLSGTSI